MIIVSILVGAAVLGIIIMAMEKGEFPGWVKMIICVLAANVPSILIHAVLGPEHWILGVALGTVCAGMVISALLGMSIKRACIAAGIYFLFQIALGYGIGLMVRS